MSVALAHSALPSQEDKHLGSTLNASAEGDELLDETGLANVPTGETSLDETTLPAPVAAAPYSERVAEAATLLSDPTEAAGTRSAPDAEARADESEPEL